MGEIIRVLGGARGRTAGSAFGGFAWAVATADNSVADVAAQTRDALAKLDGILTELGTDKTRLINATVYLDKIAHKAAMDAVWCTWIGDDPRNWPQRACVEARLEDHDLVEIVVIAANDKPV